MFNRLGGVLARKLGFRQAQAPHLRAFRVQRNLLNALGVTEPVILDIGANVGQSVRKYRKVFPSSNIHCFEPFPEAFAQLESTYGLEPDVRLNPQAVADAPGKRDLFVNAALSGISSLLPRAAGNRRYFAKSAHLDDTVEVELTTIDDYLKSKAMERVDIMKLDIQGGELSAFRGAVETLAGQRVSLIFSETFFVPHYEDSPLFFQLWEFLAGYDYTLYNLYNLCHARNGQLRYCDALFVSPQVRAAAIDRRPEEP